MTKRKDETLKKAINNLSSKKNVVSQKSIDAKIQLDHSSNNLHIPPGEHKNFLRHTNTISHFNDSVELLSTIFQKSHFDRLALFISNPSKVLILNFIIGIVQGLGVALGIFFVSFLFLYLLKENISPHVLETINELISYLFEK